MNIGTRSILFGVHAFWLHPWQVAHAWWTMFDEFPTDPRLWVAFFVHDLGYWGQPNMDGPEGEAHPFFGAHVMVMFDDPLYWWQRALRDFCDYWWGANPPYRGISWRWFVLCHSRFLASRYDMPVSRLCYVDKLVFCRTPWWLYRILANASGEIFEYMHEAKPGGKYADNERYDRDLADRQERWLRKGQAYMFNWLMEHSTGKPDTWTRNERSGDFEQIKSRKGGISDVEE